MHALKRMLLHQAVFTHPAMQYPKQNADHGSDGQVMRISQISS